MDGIRVTVYLEPGRGDRLVEFVRDCEDVSNNMYSTI